MILSHHDQSPQFGARVFVAPNAVIIGEVEIGRDSSIWFGTVVRGDVHSIRIGERTNIQDLSMCHVTTSRWPLVIGDEVTVGHSAVVHGCVIGDRCLIGMGAKILDGAVIGAETVVAAGSLVREGMRVPSGVLIAGVPAVVKRKLRPEERSELAATARRYVKYKNDYIALRIQHPGLPRKQP